MNIKIENTYTKAYVEILEIINYMGQEYKNKLPTKLLVFFEKNRDKDYEYKLESLDLSTPFLKETLIILALIEQKYWATNEEKEILDQSLKENERIYQEGLMKKYNTDNLFSNENIKTSTQTTTISQKTEEEETTTAFLMDEYKESIFIRIKKWIKQIFSK